MTFDKSVMKHGARKVRRIAGGRSCAGFAGSAADGITLLEKFEAKLGEYKDNIVRGAVELAKDWRQDRGSCAGSKRCSSSAIPITSW